MEELNVIVLMKGDERYVFLYDDKSATSLMQTLGKYASDKSLSFTWYDAAVLSQKVRKSRQKTEAEAELESDMAMVNNRLEHIL